jgi:VWFA-related protein
MRKKSTWPAGLVLPFLLPAMTVRLAGQSEPPPISVNVNLVVLHATVRDHNAGFVANLPRDAFHVFEDSKPQEIRLFKYEDTPVTVGLVLDNSSSMAKKRKDVFVAALKFVHASNPRDELFIVNFNEKVSLGLPEEQMFSTSFSDLVAALNGVPAKGMTALYDGIDAGLTHLMKGGCERKALIVVSDGGDNASYHRLDELLHRAERSDATIYTIGLFDEDDEDRNPRVLKKIARATGGEFYLPAETSKVIEVCQKIAADIRHQYTIGYVPSNSKQDGSYRAVEVKVNGKASVRTRAGYIASGAAQ